MQIPQKVQSTVIFVDKHLSSKSEVQSTEISHSIIGIIYPFKGLSKNQLTAKDHKISQNSQRINVLPNSSATFAFPPLRSLRLLKNHNHFITVAILALNGIFDVLNPGVWL